MMRDSNRAVLENSPVDCFPREAARPQAGNPTLSASKNSSFVRKAKEEFLNDVFRCAERDVHFVRDVCFANDVRFARGKGTHHITASKASNITMP